MHLEFRESLTFWGKTDSGHRYVIAHEPQCEVCGGVICTDNYDERMTTYTKTGMCDDCFATPDGKAKADVDMRELAEAGAWLQERALRNSLMRQAEARR